MSVSPSDADGSMPNRQILLDNPSTRPALGYGAISRAFATIISQSEPRFAIGIFGKWGSGKTTLMKAIQAALKEDSLVIVDFNAWRFEREPQLLIPLLDSVRAGLVRWSEQRDEATRAKVRSVANRIGRVVRALAKGLSAEVGVPGAVKIGYDVSTALDALSPPEAAQTAQSLYVAAFQELERAFGEFSEGGVTRVVVFVDDLDRCLPSNALDVLESMKLFFDLRGFVFVVGLDENVIERAIRAKFAAQDEPSTLGATQSPTSVEPASQRLAREYIKKIFQVPYSLPPMVPEQLDDLLKSMYGEATLHSSQLDDLRERVSPYLKYVAVERRVNPREVKRFLNAYTLQTLIRPELDRDTVLALQTFTFRYEWNLLYDAIFSDSAAFIDALDRYRQGEDDAFKDLLPDLEVLPISLAKYLRSPQAEPLLHHRSLDRYLSSLRETRADRSAADERGFAVLATVDELSKLVRSRDYRTDIEAWTDRINTLATHLTRYSRNASSEIKDIASQTYRIIRSFINNIEEANDAEEIDRLADDLWMALVEARTGLGYAVEDR
jgi:hypothetical protein